MESVTKILVVTYPSVERGFINSDEVSLNCLELYDLWWICVTKILVTRPKFRFMAGDMRQLVFEALTAAAQMFQFF